MDEIKAVGDELGEDIGVEHDDDADDRGQGDRVPEDETEDGAFLADLVGGGGGDADGLGVDHFAHDAAGAVGGAHENRAEVELLGGDFLQASEENVGRGVAAGERDAEPADESAEEGEEPAGARKGEAEDGIHPGVARDVAEAEHAGHGDDREAQAEECAAEDFQDFAGAEAENQAGEKSGEEAGGAGGGEPVEIEAGCFGGGFGDDRSGAKHFVVECGPVPSSGAGAIFSIGELNGEGGSGGFIHGELDAGQAPR